MASDRKDVSSTTGEVFTNLSNEQLLAKLSDRADHLRHRLSDLEATGMFRMMPLPRHNRPNENDREWVEIFVEEVGKMLEKANDLEFLANKK